MRRFALYLSLCAGFACTASAFAGVGTTSAGVTTTDPNNPSTDVEQQSSGFVAANQQSQNGTTGSVTLATGVAGTTQAGQAATGNADAKGAQSVQAEQGAAANQAAPATPPPPPPTYESKMRPVNQSAATTVVSTPAPEHVEAVPPAQPRVHMPAKTPEPAAKPPVVAPAAAAKRGPPVEKPVDEPAPATAVDPGGGRGAAPDGYTFWFGLLIAGALLALAAVTWLRIQRGETPG